MKLRRRYNPRDKGENFTTGELVSAAISAYDPEGELECLRHRLGQLEVIIANLLDASGMSDQQKLDVCNINGVYELVEGEKS